MKFCVVIPARFDSSRLPGKPLAIIGDKPMIQHVYERALLSGAEKVIVATDDERIAKVIEDFGGEACMTSADHTSGSDRLAEVCQLYKFVNDQVVVNVQGDEPFISPENIKQVADNLLANPDCPMATLSVEITDNDDVFDPNVVKVVSNNKAQALYFSRAPIAWQRGSFENKQAAELSQCQRHIGIYAYRADFLAKYVKLPAAEIERLESLEQLRVLANGYSIHIEQAKEVPGMGVDTTEDLVAANEHYRHIRL